MPQRSSHITNDAYAGEKIIQKFQNEDEFRKERENFTYTQVVLQTVDDDGQWTGNIS